MRYTYVGADNHKHSHTFVFINFMFEKVGELVVSSTPSDFEPFLKEAQRFLQPHTAFIFAFEDVTHYGRTLVNFLIGKGYTVKHVNANLVSSERKAYNVIQKTDSIDALCAARVLISRFDALPIVKPDEKYYIMNVLVSKRQSLSRQTKRLKGTLHSLLFPQYPNYHDFFSSLNTKSALAFYAAYPSPHTLDGVTEDQLTDFFSVIIDSRRARAKATLILDLVKKSGVATNDFQDSIDHTIRFTVMELKTANQHLEDIEDRLAKLLISFNCPLTSMSGIDTLTACRLIAEVGDISRFKNSASLAQYAGIAPIPHSSGNSDIKRSNKRGNRQLNSIIYGIALILIAPKGGQITNPFFYNFYHQKISEGKTKKQALKVVQRRLINIIYGMMKHGVHYINPPIIYIDETQLNDNQLTHIQKRRSTFKSTT